jgi:hypothetical protein
LQPTPLTSLSPTPPSHDHTHSPCLRRSLALQSVDGGGGGGGGVDSTVILAVAVVLSVLAVCVAGAAMLYVYVRRHPRVFATTAEKKVFQPPVVDIFIDYGPVSKVRGLQR